MKRVWTPEEDEILRERFPISSTSELGIALGKDWKKVGKRAWDLGLRKEKGFLSSQKSRLHTKNRKCIMLNCGKKHSRHGYCDSHAVRFEKGQIDSNGNISYTPIKKWNASEVSLLKEIYSFSTRDDLKIAFPERSVSSIMTTACALSLKKDEVTRQKCHKTKMTLQSKISSSCTMRGIKPEEFNGFITPLNIRIRVSPKNKEWRKSVFEKDNYTCQKCNKVGSGDLNAHHIKSLSSLMKEYPQKEINTNDDYFFDTSNGVTLCEKCHNELHRGKGKKNLSYFPLLSSEPSLHN